MTKPSSDHPWNRSSATGFRRWTELSVEQRRRIQQLRREGHTIRQIRAITGHAQETIMRWMDGND